MSGGVYDNICYIYIYIYIHIVCGVCLVVWCDIFEK